MLPRSLEIIYKKPSRHDRALSSSKAERHGRIRSTSDPAARAAEDEVGGLAGRRIRCHRLEPGDAAFEPESRRHRAIRESGVVRKALERIEETAHYHQM
jgi:hypothetical protein